MNSVKNDDLIKEDTNMTASENAMHPMICTPN